MFSKVSLNCTAGTFIQISANETNEQQNKASSGTEQQSAKRKKLVVNIF